MNIDFAVSAIICGSSLCALQRLLFFCFYADFWPAFSASSLFISIYSAAFS